MLPPLIFSNSCSGFFCCFAYAIDEDDCTALECYVNAECVLLEDGAMCQCLKGFTRKGKSCYGNKNIIITFEKLWIGGEEENLFPFTLAALLCEASEKGQ